MSDAAKIAILTPAELEQLLARAVDQAVGRMRAELVAPLSEWLNADEAAELLGVSRDYLRRITDLPVHGKSARSRRYKRSELEHYMIAKGGGRPGIE